MDGNFNSVVTSESLHKFLDFTHVKTENLEGEGNNDPENDEENVLDPHDVNIGQGFASQDEDVKNVEEVEEDVDEDQDDQLHDVSDADGGETAQLLEELGDSFLLARISDVLDVTVNMPQC